jgi:hypothetical protein
MLGILQIDISEVYPRQNKNLSPVSGFCFGSPLSLWLDTSNINDGGGTMVVAVLPARSGSDHDIRVLLP